MTPQSEALDLILAKLKAEKGYKIALFALPKEGGISAEITGSENKGRSLNLQHGSADLTVLFLCKSKTQAAAFDTLYDIGNYLDRIGEVKGKTIQVTGAGVRSGAGLVGNENGFYIYSMIAQIGIYF
ncbi:MAG: hypothetical protein NC394_08450 [Bacteroides sp.]|nr:hypothetical protein [Bacteroides sp.]